VSWMSRGWQDDSAMMMPGYGLGIVVGLPAVLVVHFHQRSEVKRSREKARDEPIIGQIVGI